MSRKSYRRRTLLSIFPFAMTSGCLRLQSGDSVAESSTTPPSSDNDDSAEAEAAEKQGGTDQKNPTDNEGAKSATSESSTDEIPDSIDGEWPQFMYDAANRGYSDSLKGPKQTANVVWRYSTKSNADVGLALANETVYLGDWSDTVYAIDAITGEQKWQRSMPHSVAFSTPAVKDGVVLIGCHDNKLYALTEDDGAFQWVFETNGSIWSSPTVSDSNVYLSSTGGRLYCLSFQDGAEQWRFEPQIDAGTAGFLASPATDGSNVYIGDLELPEGSSPPEGYIFDPSVKRELLQMDIGGRIFSLDVETGDKDWEFEAGHGFVGSPAVDNGTVYVGNYDKRLYAISARNGEEEWSVETQDAIAATPAVTGENVYIGSWDGSIYAYGSASGEREWFFPTGEQVIGSPIVADGMIYVNGHDGAAYGLGTDGRMRWRTETHTSGPGGPAVSNGMMFVCGKGRTDPEGAVVALG